MTQAIKNNKENKVVTKDSAKNPMPQFLGWTFVSLLITVFAMYVLNTYFKLADDDVGSLGGAFQGTLGVAAAVAGAIVTIRLAKIAIDQAQKSNDIAARQERNENVDFLLAKEAKAAINKINACHAIVENSYRVARLTYKPANIPLYALEHLGDALTSNAISQMLALADENSELRIKYQSSAAIGKLLYSIEQMLESTDLGAIEIKDMYYLNAYFVFERINSVIRVLDPAITLNAKESSYSDFKYHLSQVISEDDIIPIEQPKVWGSFDIAFFSESENSFANILEIKLKDFMNKAATEKIRPGATKNLMSIMTLPSDIVTIDIIRNLIDKLRTDTSNLIFMDGASQLNKLLHSNVWSSADTNRYVFVLDGINGDVPGKLKQYLEDANNHLFQEIQEFIKDKNVPEDLKEYIAGSNGDLCRLPSFIQEIVAEGTVQEDIVQMLIDKSKNYIDIHGMYYKDLLKMLCKGMSECDFKNIGWFGGGWSETEYDADLIDSERIFTIVVDYREPSDSFRDEYSDDPDCAGVAWLERVIRKSTERNKTELGALASELGKRA